MDFFDLTKREVPFVSYQEYTDHLFACVDKQLSTYIDGLMRLFFSDNGGFKNVLYPDIEVARDLCEKHLMDFRTKDSREEEMPELPDEFSDLFGDLAEAAEEEQQNDDMPVEDLLAYINHRASLTKVPLPLYRLCRKLDFSPFTTFCFACAILSSTQTNYASVFQVVNSVRSTSAFRT